MPSQRAVLVENTKARKSHNSWARARQPRVAVGSSIALLDAKTNEWIQNIPAPPNALPVVISQDLQLRA
jgi:hypothetical protein